MRDFRPGQKIDRGTYRSFEPSIINRQWQIEDMELITLLSQASEKLGRLDMFSERVPNLSLFLSMHLLKEATESSKIEGTQTRIDEALLSKDAIKPERRDDWQEVQNYFEALTNAMEHMEKFPFSSRLIKIAHKVLLQGVRGKHKLPGQFRTSQNWISGSGISDAKFVPPIHENVNDYMSDLEMFAHNDKINVPDLIRIAIIHYQFETIHPFLDGNGRVGRLMIAIYLYEKKVLSQPILYLSEFFERHRSVYTDRLMDVREKGDIESWIKFFLRGVCETADKGVTTLDKMLKLKEQTDKICDQLSTKNEKLRLLFDELYTKPIITAKRASIVTGMTMPTVYSMIEDLERHGVLKELTGAKRNRIYIYEDYLNLFR